MYDLLSWNFTVSIVWGFPDVKTTILSLFSNYTCTNSGIELTVFFSSAGRFAISLPVISLQPVSLLPVITVHIALFITWLGCLSQVINSAMSHHIDVCKLFFQFYSAMATCWQLVHMMDMQEFGRLMVLLHQHWASTKGLFLL